MAIITRGKRRGEIVEIGQMANDWISLTDGSIYSPLSIELTSLKEAKRMKEDKSSGMFWNLFELTKYLKFKRRKFL